MRTTVAGVLLSLAASTAAFAQSTLQESPETTALDPASLAVLPVEALSIDPVYEDIAAAVDAYLQRSLANAAGWSLISTERVAAFADQQLSPKAWAAELGAGTVLQGSVSAHRNGYSYRYAFIDAATGSHHISGNTYAGQPWDPETGLTERLTQQIDDAIASFAEIFRDRDAFMGKRLADKAAARSRFLDQNNSAAVRLTALMAMQPPYILRARPVEYADGGESLSGEVALAAIELAQTSPDPKIRARVWNVMRAVPEASLVDPLLAALGNDPDANVRLVTANALQMHTGTPGVSDALDTAAQTDPDARVREAAFLAVASTDEFIAYQRHRVLDESLPPGVRRFAISRLSTLNDIEPFAIDSELLNAIAHWAESTDDRSLRGSIWYSVGKLGGDAAPALLVGALESEPDETVRESIVSALHNVVDQPGVRDIIAKAAVDDESPLVRKAAEWSLERSENTN
ncbi:MAG: HEAT repeat domain-containing protein [Pseudomonadota bacterium]